MLDLVALRQLVEEQEYAPLFVTVSGAHLYGFPSPDSDVDLRGCHRLPLRDVVGLRAPDETLERKLDLRGVEVELVSHDIGKYLRLLVKNNGYILEQVFSPIVVTGQEFLDRLRPLARRCITRHHYHHYRGFLDTQRKLLEKQEPKVVKTVLYAYRVVLTGIHLLRTGEVVAHLPTLAHSHGLSSLTHLIAHKRQEKVQATDLDWAFHKAQLEELEARMTQEFETSPLPEHPDLQEAHEFLIGVRLGEPGGNHGA